MRRCLIVILIFGFFGCTSSSEGEKLAQVKEQLENATNEIAALQLQIEPEGELVHFVFLDLKNESDVEHIIREIQKLDEIQEVQDLQVGPFESLGDPRAMTQFDLVMEMSFEDESAYQRYQKHTVHLELKEKLGGYLAGPPATYDYIKH